MTCHSNITEEGGIRGVSPEDVGFDGAAGTDPSSQPSEVEDQDRAEPRFKFLSVSDLLAREAPEDLIHGVLPLGGLVCLYGPPGGGKTFTALSMSCSVASGCKWLGKATKSGPVVYIAAEGVHRLGYRVLAATSCDRENVGPAIIENLYFLDEGVQLAEEHESEELLRAILRLPKPPVLIVVDTLARCSLGREENSAKDMGLFIAGCDELRRATGATILPVHHTTKQGGSERGSSALRGAADTMIELSQDGERLILRCDKQKEAAPFEDVELELVQVDVGVALNREPITSCRVGLKESETSGGWSHAGMGPASLTICRTLRDHFFEDGAASTNLREVCKIPKSTFQRHIRSLTDMGYVDRCPVGSSHKFRLTDKFHDPEVSQVSPGLSGARQPVGPGLTPPPPLEGGGSGTGPEPATGGPGPEGSEGGHPPDVPEDQVEVGEVGL